jgi:uncharacterized phiE125 gp8 family phage protein
MGLTIVTPAALEPVSLGEAKDHCRVDGADFDAMIAGHLIAARQHCEQYTGRAFVSRTYDLTIDWGWPTDGCGPRIELPRPPAVSVSSITYIDSAGASQVLSPGDYVLSKGSIYGSIVPGYFANWPAVRSQRDAITVRFVAGYGSQMGDVPEPIRHAILMYTRFLLDAKTEDEDAAHRLLSLYRAEFF